MVYPVSYNDYAKKTPLLDRFIRYALIPTGSDPESAASPSAAREFDLARVLESELRALGAKDVTLSEKGVVTATIPASSGAEKAPVILLNSHMDTSPEASCEGIHPHVLTSKHSGQNQKVYDFNNIGLMVWVWRKKIRSILISNYEDE